MNKKGKLIDMAIPIVLLFVVAAIGIGLSSYVFDNIKQTQTLNTTEYNTTAAVSEGVGIFADLMPGLGAVVGAFIIIAIIMLFILKWNRG